MLAELLVVEDDPFLAGAIGDALTNDGYHAHLAASAQRARELCRAVPVDLVVLDLGLPDEDGVDLCRALRLLHPRVRIVVVTARDADIDVIVSLDAGANDYVVKPFSIGVLLARIRAQLRTDAPPAGGAADEQDIGDLRIEFGARRVTSRHGEIALRPREFDVLALLAYDCGRVVTKDRILTAIWRTGWDRSTHKALEMHIHHLRNKLGVAPGEPGWIATVRSIGYRLESR